MTPTINLFARGIRGGAAPLYSRDASSVLSLLRSFAAEGPEKLFVLTDFDRTVTTGSSKSAHGVVESSPHVSPSFRTTATTLYNKYFKIEIDPNLTVEEKLPHMLDWYRLNHDNLVENGGLERAHIHETDLSGFVTFRDSAVETLRYVGECGVPLAVLSAGVRDVIDKILTEVGVSVDDLVSNEMIFGEKEPHLLVGFDERLVHMYNKNLEMASESFKKKIEGRTNCLLIGDGIGDSTMSKCKDFTVDEGRVLKIGFLNNDFEKDIDKYCASFDIVIVGADVGFEMIQDILKGIIGGDCSVFASDEK